MLWTPISRCASDLTVRKDLFLLADVGEAVELM